MSVIRLTPQQLTAQIRKDAREFPRQIRRGLLKAAKRGERLLGKAMPVGTTGHLKNAWEVEMVGNDVHLVNRAPHAGIMERGARPHKVSVEGQEQIRQWIRKILKTRVASVARQRKAYGGEDRGFGKLRQNVKQNEADYIEEILQGILWKIRTKGQEGRYIVKGSIPELQKYAQEEVERQLGKHHRTAAK